MPPLPHASYAPADTIHRWPIVVDRLFDALNAFLHLWTFLASM